MAEKGVTAAARGGGVLKVSEGKGNTCFSCSNLRFFNNFIKNQAIDPQLVQNNSFCAQIRLFVLKLGYLCRK